MSLKQQIANMEREMKTLRERNAQLEALLARRGP